LTVRTVRTAFAASGLGVSRDDTVPAVRRALQRSHILGSLLVTNRGGTASVAEITVFDTVARAERAVKGKNTVSCLGTCSQSEAFTAARVRVRNVVVAPEPIYDQSAAETADLQRLLRGLDGLRKD
jgi:hypothetical protein